MSNISDLSDDVKSFTPEQSFNLSQLSKSNQKQFNAELSYDQIRRRQFKLPKFRFVARSVSPVALDPAKLGLSAESSLDASVFESKSSGDENVNSYKSPYFHAISKIYKRRQKLFSSYSS